MNDVGHYSFVLNQGTTFVLRFYLEDDDGVPINTSTDQFRGQIRRKFNSPDILASFVFLQSAVSPYPVSAILNDVVSSGVPAGRWHYDIERVAAGTTSRLLEGRVRVSPEVTK